MSGFLATKADVFYNEQTNVLLLRQPTYSNFEFEGNKYLLGSGPDYEYCDYLNTEKFKHKYFLYTLYNLETRESYEYILKKEHEEQGYEQYRMYTIREDEDVMFHCRENEKELVFFAYAFEELEIGLSKLGNHYYEYLVDANCSFVYKQEFARDEPMEFTYIRGNSLLVKFNSSFLRLYIDKEVTEIEEGK